MSILNLFSRTVSGDEAAAMGYVNAGTDKRIGGELGKFLGNVQRELSFKDASPPTRRVTQLGNVLLEIATAPNGREHYAVAIPRGSGRWFTFRVGYRFDGNWGDHNVIGHNPSPEIVGGYIPDVVLKARATQTFIAGHELGWNHPV
jgi:hypothetical protein